MAVVHGPLSSPTSAGRLMGVRDALAAAGREVEPGCVLESDLTMEGGYRCAEVLLGSGRRFEAIWCGNDPIAYGVQRRAREIGLAVPNDMAVWGFDDNPMNEWLAPWLNTVRVPHTRYAEARDGADARDAPRRGRPPGASALRVAAANLIAATVVPSPVRKTPETAEKGT